MQLDDLRISVVMDGSRRHYDVAKALHQLGCLENLFADWYAVPGSIECVIANCIARARPRLGLRMLERYSSQIPVDRIIRNPMLTLRTNLTRPYFKVPEEYWRWVSELTANWIARHGFGDANCLYGYVRNLHPALCRIAREKKLIVLGEQMIAPAAIEREECEKQQLQWPGWEVETSFESLRMVEDVEIQTWSNVDKILAPSQYVASGLVKQGVKSEQVYIVPYPAEFKDFDFVDRSDRSEPVRIGFVGQINLRKNAPVFFEVAKRLFSDRVVFEMVGKNYISEDIVREYSQFVKFAGSVPRSQVFEKLAAFDIFFFPSTCEGSAGVVLEAMATGLPIVTTPNSGTIVENGISGFIFEPNDIDAITRCIEGLVASRDLRLALGLTASQKVSELTLLRYGKSIASAFRD